MLEILALIWLSRDIGRLAESKGLKKSTWIIYLIGGWIVTEIIGCIVGYMIFGPNNLVSVALVGIAFAFTSYFGLRTILQKFPDHWQDDIDNFGSKIE